MHPSKQPLRSPTDQPSKQPSLRPTVHPSKQPTAFPSRQPSRQPLHCPTSQPSEVPSHHPSDQPTKQPTVQPSVKPTSSRPTSLPTSSPTCYPKTSRPTLVGETNNPSRYSTSHPTYNMHNMFSSDYYKDFASNSSNLKSMPNSLTFSTFYYKGDTVNGSCSDWNAFTNVNAAIPLETIRYTGITGYFDIYDFGRNVRATVSTTCNVEGIMKSFMSSLNSDSSFQYYCNGYTWRIFTCAGSKVLCVNCKEVCVKTVTCPGTSFSISPCTTCKFDFSAGSVVNIQYTFDDLSPKYIVSPTINNINSTSVSLYAKLDRVGQIKCAAFLSPTVLTNMVDLYTTAIAADRFGNGMEYNLILTGLVPSSNYRLYCYTDDLANHIMSLSIVLNYTVHFNTSCCKSKKFSISCILLNSIILFALYFRLCVWTHPTNNITIRYKR